MLERTIMLFCFICLIYASYQDIKNRNIPNNLWLLMFLVAILYAIYNLYIFGISFLTTLLYSFLFTLALSYLFFTLNLFGGADAKVLICVSLLIPVCNVLYLPFAIVVLTNAVLISLVVVFTLFFYNVLTLPINEITTLKNIKYWFIGYKLHVNKIVNAKHTKLLYSNKENEKEVWVTPEIPFMVFITVGFVVSVFWGCVVL